MNLKLIGLAAKARSGKDTVGEYLREEYNYKLYAFADPIKQAASKMFGVPSNYFYDDDLKEEIIDYWGFSPRQIAQKLGTEGGRDLFRQDIWVKRGLKEWEDYKERYNEITKERYEMLELDIEPHGLIFTDVRFENESDMIKENGGKIVHIIRTDAEVINAHVSEKGIEIKEDDIVIYNNDSLEELYINVSDILGD